MLGVVVALLPAGVNAETFDQQVEALVRPLSNGLADMTTIFSPVLSDDRRLIDLTHLISQEDNSVIVHRLDRFAIDYTGTQTVARAGRQAVSWGNGLIYTPMDFFNPFDPATVDKEYKTGDDMLYGQYLRNNGDDLQAV